MKRFAWTCLCVSSALWPRLDARAQDRQAIGVFTGSVDVGTPSTIGPGSATFDAGKGVYTIAGGGENMWGKADHFHYVWKKVSGNIALAATIAFVGTRPSDGTPEGHRKACLVIRQTLDSDSVYIDAARHGDGLTSLQWRDTAGGITQELRSTVAAPARLRIEKRGNSVSMLAGGADEELRPAAGPATIELTGDFYIGLGVTSHNVNRIETATFSNVELKTLPPEKEN
jgi:TolB protein